MSEVYLNPSLQGILFRACKSIYGSYLLHIMGVFHHVFECPGN